MLGVHQASRIMHHASCTLDDASLALQRDAELRRLAPADSSEQSGGAAVFFSFGFLWFSYSFLIVFL